MLMEQISLALGELFFDFFARGVVGWCFFIIDPLLGVLDSLIDNLSRFSCQVSCNLGSLIKNFDAFHLCILKCNELAQVAIRLHDLNGEDYH